MKKMQTLTVNGKTYEISDPNAVTGQQLTEREQVLLGRLCPSFSESGAAVKCEPVEGYPLKVTTELHASESGISKITLTQSGKNLFDYTQYTFEDKLITHAGGISQASSGFSSTPDYIPVSHLRGLTITLNHPAGEKTPTTTAGLAFYDANKKYISGSSGYSHTVPENAEYIRFSVPREWINGEYGTKEDIQIELGGEVTECEPYWQWEYTAELDEPVFGGSHVWSNIEAHAGVNTFWCNIGTTSVEGKADPVAMINNLSDQVAALSKTINTLLEG